MTALPADIQASYNKKTRKAMAAMARSLGIIPEQYTSIEDLWNELSDRMKGGVHHPSERIMGDPFAVFVTAICQEMHEGKGWFRQTAVVKTTERVDQAEGEKIIAYLKSQAPVNTCDACHKPITTYQTDCTRMSTFAAQRMEMDGFDGGTIVGSDT